MGKHDNLPLFFSSLVKISQPLMIAALQLVHFLISLTLPFQDPNLRLQNLPFLDQLCVQLLLLLQFFLDTTLETILTSESPCKSCWFRWLGSPAGFPKIRCFWPQWSIKVKKIECWQRSTLESANFLSICLDCSALWSFSYSFATRLTYYYTYADKTRHLPILVKEMTYEKPYIRKRLPTSSKGRPIFIN